MMLLKTKVFSKWAKSQRISDKTLKKTIEELGNGYFEASLGGFLYKKRVSRPNEGKSGGYRTIICFKKEERAIFLHGFSKSDTENISTKDKKALKILAKDLLSYSEEKIKQALKINELQEIA